MTGFFGLAGVFLFILQSKAKSILFSLYHLIQIPFKTNYRVLCQVGKSEENFRFLCEYLGQFCERLPNDTELEDDGN